MRTPLRKLFSAMLACAITIGIAPVTTHAEGEGYTVQIQYDENTTIHSVDKNGTTVILYCLQDKRHWPHTIQGSIETIPLYREITFEEFCRQNGLTNEADISALAEKMRRVLYAGYDYNGLGVYSSDGIVQITEEEFNSLLALADDDPLRKDFPDSIGKYIFTYANRNSQEQIGKVTKFMQEAMDRIRNHTISASGMTPSELEILPFYRAAFCLANYRDDPLGAISAWNTAYNATSYAVWSLAGKAGIAGAEDLSVVGLGKKLLDAAENSNASVLKSEPTVSPQLTQNAVFTYNDNDQKWYSSPITLSAEEISTWFTLSQLPSGITAVDEKGKVLTEIKPGDTFSLVSDQEPSGDTEVSVSSSVPWMVGDLVVYEPDPSVVAPDGNSFQNMIGVVIHHTEMSAKATVRKVDETTSLSFTKQWNDDGNVSGKRPDASSYAKRLTLLADGNEMSGYEAEITDNGDNTYTVSYKGLPKLVDGKTVTYSVKEAAVEGYTSDSSVVSDGGTLVNTLIVPTPSPTATATVTENTPAPTATVKVTANKPAPAVSPSAVKAVPPTGVKSSYGENSH